MGGLNGKVGKEQDLLNVTVDPHGLKERNERGDLWTEWCSTHNHRLAHIDHNSVISESKYP